MTQMEKEQIRDYVISYLIANSQTINGLPDVTSLEGISSFPVIQQQDGNNYIAKKVPFDMIIPKFRYNSGYIQYKDLITGNWINIISSIELEQNIDLSGYVKLTEDQIVDGIKTFNNSPIVPDPTTSFQAANKKYADDGLSLKVDKSTEINSGNGLTGGGALSANITLNVVSANDGIIVNTDNVQLNTINTLTDTSTTKPLSAAKGKELNDRIIPFENAFTFEGTGTQADPYKVRVNYSIYSVGDIIGSGSGAIYECSDTAIASYNSSATASKALAAGDVLIYDGTYWRNVANNTSAINGLDAIITELRRLASATNNGLMSSSDFNKLNNVATYVSTLGAVTTSATNNTITVTTYNPATGANSTTTLTFPSATTSLAGLMSAADKAKLDGIAAGANNYTHPNSGVTAGTYKSVNVNAAGHVTAGTNPTTLSGYGITDAAPSSHVGATGTAHGVATTSVNGFMSSTDKTKLDGVATNANNYVHPSTHSADIIVDGITNKAYTATEKTKLDGITTGADVSVNSDWNAVSGKAQILNKPNLDAIVPISKGGTGLTVIGSPNQILKVNSGGTALEYATTSESSSGTVTSIAVSAPIGFSVSGSPITTFGTIAISLTEGYSIPTIIKQSNWDSAYSWGNHSGLYRLISYVPSWSEVSNKPTTLGGYGITDAYTKTEVDTK